MLESDHSPMRRWLRYFFPVVTLVVLVQILAPIGAVRAAALALDPFSSVPICSAHTDSENPSSQDDPSGKSTPSHATCCPLCAAGQAFALPPVDPATSIAPPWSSRELAFVVRNQRGLTVQLRGPAQARAPPQLS
jgi:hypothetical protein